MAERSLSPLAYIAVLAALYVLTILTVGLTFVPSSGLMHIVMGQSIAVLKAALVVLFFMHALRSPRQTHVVIIITIVWFAVVLLSLTLSDYVTRGMLPNMPGH
jgi:cytochrome c oxidase subunit IV